MIFNLVIFYVAGITLSVHLIFRTRATKPSAEAVLKTTINSPAAAAAASEAGGTQAAGRWPVGKRANVEWAASQQPGGLRGQWAEAEAVNGHGRGQIDVKDLRCDKQINCRHHASHCSNSHLLCLLILLDDLQWPQSFTRYSQI